MNNTIKDQPGNDVICRNHLAKSERDLYRICPAKLTKRELEDLYFALLENNLDLKKTVHSQQDKLKVLSTKVQRMTVAQRNAGGKTKDCCSCKVLLNEQKEIIADQKKANECMAEKIRILNMRLCSAKQFLKRSPSRTKCPRCCINVSIPLKNSSLSALNKPSEASGIIKKTDISSQYISVSKDPLQSPKSTRTVETETDLPEKDGREMETNDNKYTTLKEELKQKIVNLQEELSRTHEEYSMRISKLENDLSGLHSENVRVKSGKVASDHALQQLEQKADALKEKLREAEGRSSDLTMQLTIERRKVTELETALKLANTSSEVVKIIEKMNIPKQPQAAADVCRACSNCSRFFAEQDTEVLTTREGLSTLSSKPKEEEKFTKSDDSGCTDLNKSSEAEEEKVMERLNQEMWKRISELQSQLDGLRIKAAGESAKVEKLTAASSDFDKYNDGKQTAVTGITEERPNFPPQLKENDSRSEKDADKFTTFKDLAAEKADTTCVRPGEDNMAKNSTKDVQNTYDDIKSDSSVTLKCPSVSQTKIDTLKKDDNDNKYQIPGPITSLGAKKEKNKQFKNSASNSKKSTGKKGTSEQNSVKTNNNIPVIEKNNDYVRPDIDGLAAKINETVLKNDDIGSEIPKQNIKTVDQNIETAKDDLAESNIKNFRKTNSDMSTVSTNKLPENIINASTPVANHKKLNKDNLENVNEISKPKEDKTSEELSKVKKESSPGHLIHSDTAIGPSASVSFSKSVMVSRSRSIEKATATHTDKADVDTLYDVNIDEYELCASRVTVCRCPERRRRDVSVFRTCSSTLRLHTAAATENFRQCACLYKPDSGTQLEAEQPVPSVQPPRDSVPRPARSPAVAPARRDSATYTKNGTYTVDDKSSRATSPANTEREISSLSDLPREKDVKSPRGWHRASRSPGEERSTTLTDTDTDNRAFDLGTLSDGELPTPTRDARIRKLSFGEKPTYVDPVLEKSSSQMEATLNAISEELARCRQMLASSRSHEGGRGAALRAAARRVPARARAAVFTLHVGTLVLSDEAVLNSRDKSLILTWKFYDQNVAMTRMRPGRVMLFDFSTEYDVTFSEEFLRYMKQDEMPLTICEINKLDEPFATCLLPLRDALLHTNRRADMSLALVAGPAMSVRRGSDALVSGDELGVLDLWCMLRADSALLHTINRTITRVSSLEPTKEDSIRSSSRIVDSQGEDDRSDLRMTQGVAPQSSRTYRNDSLDTADTSGHYRWRSSQKQKTFPSSISDHGLGHNSRVGFEENWLGSNLRQRSRLIVNEVPSNIKSLDEMKQALERNMQTTRRNQKIDDELSQGRSSMESLKCLATKHHLQKLKTQKPTPSSSHESQALQDMLTKERKMSIAAIVRRNSSRKAHVPFGNNSREEEEIDPSIARKYNNAASSSTGLNKMMETSKKTVKYTDDAPDYADQPVKQESNDENQQSIDITVLWLALNEECEAMVNPQVQRLYVAYSFLGRRGAELETPVSLPKPKHYADKCYFNFKKTFQLYDADLPLLGHMSRCRAGRAAADPRDCLVFTVVSEPPEDPLGLSSCVDIGHAYLYLGDILAYSAGGAGGAGYTEVVPVRGAGRGAGAVCGVLAVRVDGLHVLRRCLSLSRTPPGTPSAYIPQY